VVKLPGSKTLGRYVKFKLKDSIIENKFGTKKGIPLA
jgi:hypothetical protein